MKNVLVAVDFSDASGRLLGIAEEEARMRGGRLFLCHVIEPAAEVSGFETDPGMMRVSIPRDYDDERRAETSRLKELARAVEGRGVECEALIRFGLPADEVIAAAKGYEAGMVVMGSHGRGALYHLFTGSVVTGVLKRIEVPVLVVPLRKSE